MASVQRRSGKFRAMWRDLDGVQRSKSFSLRRDAVQHLASVTTEMAKGTYLDPRAGHMSFKDYAESWRIIQQHRATTAAQVESHLRRHVYTTLGGALLCRLRPSHLQAWVKGLDGSLSPATIKLVATYVSTILKAAVKDGLIASNPADGLKLPKVQPHRLVIPSTEEVRRVIAEVPDRYRAIIVLASGTGLRQGECFGLTVDRVDFLRRSILVDRQLQSVSGPPSLCPPKTVASVRTVPAPDVVLGSLSEHLRAYPVRSQEGYLFTTIEGRPLRRSSFGQMWSKAVARAGVEGMGMHALRHYYASLLIRHGESVKVVQARLGHASAAETLDTYSHLWPDAEDRTRSAVDSVLGTVAQPLPLQSQS